MPKERNKADPYREKAYKGERLHNHAGFCQRLMLFSTVMQCEFL